MKDNGDISYYYDYIDHNKFMIHVSGYDNIDICKNILHFNSDIIKLDILNEELEISANSRTPDYITIETNNKINGIPNLYKIDNNKMMTITNDYYLRYFSSLKNNIKSDYREIAHNNNNNDYIFYIGQDENNLYQIDGSNMNQISDDIETTSSSTNDISFIEIGALHKDVSDKSLNILNFSNYKYKTKNTASFIDFNSDTPILDFSFYLKVKNNFNSSKLRIPTSKKLIYDKKSVDLSTKLILSIGAQHPTGDKTQDSSGGQ